MVLSIPEPSPPTTATSNQIENKLLVAIAGLTGLILFFAFTFEKDRLQYDLQASSPAVVRAGSKMAIRAWALDMQGVPSFVSVPIHAALVEPGGDLVVSSAELSPSALGGVEGAVEVPAGYDQLDLLVHARVGGAKLRVFRSIQIVSEHANVESFDETTTTSSNLFIANAKSGGQPKVQIRIDGGVCVPELICTLLVDIRSQGIALQLSKGGGVVEVQDVRLDSVGLHKVSLMVRGNDPRLRLQMRDRSKVFDEQQIPIPLAMGGMLLRPSAVGDTDRSRAFTWSTIGGQPPIAVDVFHGGQWVGALSFSGGAGQFAVWGQEGRPWWIQARLDLFSTTLQRATMLNSSSTLSYDRQRFDAAPFETQRVSVPPISRSSDVHTSIRQREERRRYAWLAAAIVLLGFATSALFLRHALRSDNEAQSVLMASFLSAPPDKTRRAWLLVASFIILLMFFVVAGIVLSRGALLR